MNSCMLIYADFDVCDVTTWVEGYSAKCKYFAGNSFTMYCPVYGCTSDSKKNTEKKIHFSFPKPISKEEQKRCNIWIEFCKRKSFVPSKCTCLCSLHFSQDAYIPSHSPYFLESINFSGKRKLILKPDAVPTINKALDVAKSHKPSEAKKRQTGILSRRKVSVP